MKLLWSIFLIANCAYASYAGNIVYHKPDRNVVIGKYCDILEDPTGKMEIGEVSSSKKFKQSLDDVPNFGISHSAFWARFSIQNQSDDSHLLLNIPLPFLNLVELYEVGSSAVKKQELGEIQSFDRRVYDVTDFLFDIYINKNQTKTFYIKIQNTDMVQLPMIIGGYQSMLSFSFNKDFTIGISFGVFFIVFFYNLFIYFSIRDKSYLFYVAYVFLLFLDHAILYGYGEKYLLLDSVWMANHFSLIGSLTGIAGILFAINFLKTYIYLPKSNYLMYCMLGIFVISIILSLLDLYIESFYFTVIGCIILLLAYLQ